MEYPTISVGPIVFLDNVTVLHADCCIYASYDSPMYLKYISLKVKPLYKKVHKKKYTKSPSKHRKYTLCTLPMAICGSFLYYLEIATGTTFTSEKIVSYRSAVVKICFLSGRQNSSR